VTHNRRPNEGLEERMGAQQKLGARGRKTGNILPDGDKQCNIRKNGSKVEEEGAGKGADT